MINKDQYSQSGKLIIVFLSLGAALIFFVPAIPVEGVSLPGDPSTPILLKK